VAFDQQSHTAFVPNGKPGTLTVVREEDPDSFKVAQTLPTLRNARTSALDGATHQPYLPADPEARPANGARQLPGARRLVARV
jgi:hypothetical protein